MYYAENEAQPEKFSSIPATMWWGIATLTTVGYGDMVPITPLGKILSGIFALAGVGLLALPAGILSSGFFEVLYNKNREKDHKKCPHCGKDIHG
jgi:voltage-gated potassium channel